MITRSASLKDHAQRALLAGLACVSWLALSISAPGALAAGVNITGTEEIVYDWSQMSCAPNDFPDTPVRAFRDATNRIQLVMGTHNTRRMIGPNFDSLTHDCTVVKVSQNDPFPGHFDERGGIQSIYTFDGNEVFALINNEYHAEFYPEWCPSKASASCQYTSVTFARSVDGGHSYTSPTPPSHLVGNVPYQYAPEVRRHGVFAPSNTIEKDGYYYAMLLISRGTREQRPGACIMRTRDLADPTSWRAWDGAGFTVRFVNPYLEPSASPARHVCHPVSFDEIGSIERSLTFNTYVGKFFVIGTESKYDPQRQTVVRGLYYSFSEDLINWSDSQLLVEFPPATCSPFSIAYPSVIDHASTDRNFTRAGQNAYLYYTRFNLTNCQLGNDRDLVRVPIEFAP